MRDNATQGIDRRRFVGMIGAGATMGVAGCLGGTDSSGGDSGVQIGLLAFEPGSAPQGTAQEQAAQMAVDELNNDGGLLGEEIDLQVANTQGDTTTAEDRYLEFVVEDGVDMTAGVFQTEVMIDLMDNVAQHEVVHVSGGNTSPEISRFLADDYDQYKYHFRPYGNAVLWVESVAEFAGYMHEEEGWDTIGVLNEEFEWTQPFSNDLPGLLEEQGIDVPYNERYPGNTDNFTPLFDSLESEGVDAVLMSMAHTAGPAQIQWRDEERDFAIAGLISQINDPGAHEAFDGATEFAMSNTPGVHKAELSDQTTSFAEDYYDEYDVYPNDAFSYATYDGIKMWAEVVAQEETTDSETIVPALASHTYEGTRGTIEFNGEDSEFPHDAVFGEDRLRRVNFQWQVDDDGAGVQEVIYPDDLATSDYQEPEWF